MSEKSQYGQRVIYDVVQTLHEFRTPYSHVQYVKTLYHGNMLIMDEEVQYSTLDEHRYHYLLTQPLVSQSRNILILGGGDGMAARDLYRSPYTSSITIVDWDRQFVEFAKTNLPENRGSLQNHRTTYMSEDARKFVSSTENRYDGIIIDLPDPDGDTMETLYFDILEHIPRILNPNGIVSAHVGPVSLSEDHPNWVFIKECKYLMKQLFHTEPVFDTVYVPTFSHEWGFLACYTGISRTFERFRIENDVYNMFRAL
jgi:spermidine synthase